MFSRKKVFLKTSKKSQENTCARVFFLMKWQISACQFVKKRDSDANVFLWILRSFQNHFIYSTLPRDCHCEYQKVFHKSEVNCSPSFIDLKDLKGTYESVCLTQSVGLQYENLIKKYPIRNPHYDIFRNFQTIDFCGTNLYSCLRVKPHRVRTHSAKDSAGKYNESLANVAGSVCRKDA